MNKPIQIPHVPETSIILKNFGKVHYLDVYKIQTKSNDSVDKISTELFKIPKWVNNLMKLRDFLVGVFGLKTGKKEDIQIEPYYEVGNRAVYFTVIDRAENEIVMAENDKHLNFRTSVMIERDDTSTAIYLSTIVQYNNFFGRLYFFFVKPFHRLIVRSLLKRYNKITNKIKT